MSMASSISPTSCSGLQDKLLVTLASAPRKPLGRLLGGSRLPRAPGLDSAPGLSRLGFGTWAPGMASAPGPPAWPQHPGLSGWVFLSSPLGFSSAALLGCSGLLLWAAPSGGSFGLLLWATPLGGASERLLWAAPSG